MSDQEALKRLRSWLKPGDTVYTILRHHASTGMFRCISLIQINGKNIRDLDYNAANVMGWKLSTKHEGIEARGCGQDMGFAKVYSLSRALFPEGFGIVGGKGGKKKRPKTKAEAARMVKEGWTFYGRNGDKSGWDTDGGYALDHRWL